VGLVVVVVGFIMSNDVVDQRCDEIGEGGQLDAEGDSAQQRLLK
jgi:hypothetical protein